jgi:hypothetical protein
MPALTRFYGLKPWELEQFTFDELNEYTRQLAEHQENQAAAARAAENRAQRRR